MGWYQRLVDKVGGILFYTTIAFLVLIAVPVGALIYVFFPSPTVTVFNSIPSPDGRLSAIIHDVRSDVTVPVYTEVSIAPADRPFSRTRNPPFLTVRGRHDLAIIWLDDKVIEIYLPEGVIIYKQDRRIGEITVEYK